MARRTRFQIPEPQGVSRILEYLKEENWKSLREYLTVFVIASPFLERPDVQNLIQNVLKKKLVLDERRKIRDELVALLSTRVR
jgi:hypothetical protein